MKIKNITLCAFVIIIVGTVYGQSSPPSTLIEDGVVYIRLRTLQEYQEVGGQIYSEEAGSRSHRSRGNTLDCGRGRGCCWGATMNLDPICNIIFLTLPAQTSEEGESISEHAGLQAFYNAASKEIKFR